MAITADPATDRSYARVAQLSDLGALADSVLKELIIIKWDLGTIQTSAIERAARLFRAAVDQVGDPLSALSSSLDTGALVRFSAEGDGESQHDVTKIGDTHFEWLNHVACNLDLISRDYRDLGACEVVGAAFSSIAQGTLQSVAAISREQSLSAAW